MAVLLSALLFSACGRSGPALSPHAVDVRQAKLERARSPKVSRKSRLELIFEKAGLVKVDLRASDIRADLRYASRNNFTGVVLYDSLSSVYLEADAARKLLLAQAGLKKINPGLSLIVWDAARPLSVQRRMYERVAHTPHRLYVASPEKTGLHNYGCAVDLGLCRTDGRLLDMGTPFDYFGKKAGILNEAGFVRQGILTQTQVDNRRLLRRVMLEAGFQSITGEWWHFNACPLWLAKKKYRLIE